MAAGNPCACLFVILLFKMMTVSLHGRQLVSEHHVAHYNNNVMKEKAGNEEVAKAAVHAVAMAAPQIFKKNVMKEKAENEEVAKAAVHAMAMVPQTIKKNVMKEKAKDEELANLAVQNVAMVPQTLKKIERERFSGEGSEERNDSSTFAVWNMLRANRLVFIVLYDSVLVHQEVILHGHLGSSFRLDIQDRYDHGGRRNLWFFFAYAVDHSGRVLQFASLYPWNGHHLDVAARLIWIVSDDYFRHLAVSPDYTLLYHQNIVTAADLWTRLSGSLAFDGL